MNNDKDEIAMLRDAAAKAETNIRWLIGSLAMVAGFGLVMILVVIMTYWIAQR